MHKRDICRRAVSICMSVRLSVTFMYSVKTNEHIFIIFPLSGSNTILVFLHRTLRQYSDGNPPNRGVECRWSRQKSRFSINIWLHRVLSTVRPPSVIHTAALDRVKLVTLVAGKRRRLFSRETYDEVFMTRSVNVAAKKTEQNCQHALVIKSEAATSVTVVLASRLPVTQNTRVSVA